MTDRIDTSQIMWLREFSLPSIRRFTIGRSIAYNNKQADRPYMEVVLSTAANVQSCVANSEICSKSVSRKSCHKNIVVKITNNLYSHFDGTFFECLMQIRSKQTNVPWQNPHNTKGKVIPCQSPLTMKVRIMFKQVLVVERLFPPSGLYTYLPNNWVNVMFHRCHKSRKVDAP